MPIFWQLWKDSKFKTKKVSLIPKFMLRYQNISSKMEDWTCSWYWLFLYIYCNIQGAFFDKIMLWALFSRLSPQRKWTFQPAPWNRRWLRGNYLAIHRCLSTCSSTMFQVLRKEAYSLRHLLKFYITHVRVSHELRTSHELRVFWRVLVTHSFYGQTKANTGGVSRSMSSGFSW